MLLTLGLAVPVVLVTTAASLQGMSRAALGDALDRASSTTSAPPEILGPGQFTGEFDPTAPVVHPLELRAGEAVRIAIVSTSDELADTDDDQFDWGLSLGVAVGEKLAIALQIPEWNDEGGYDNDNFFSDYRDLYPDYDWQAPGGVSPYEPIARQYDIVWVTDDEPVLGDDPPQFGCAARLEGDDTPAISAWAVLVAPTDGVYTVMAAGLGSYELWIETQSPPVGSASVEGAAFPFTGQDWWAVVEQQRPFLFDGSFYPSVIVDDPVLSPAVVEADCFDEDSDVW